MRPGVLLLTILLLGSCSAGKAGSSAVRPFGEESLRTLLGPHLGVLESFDRAHVLRVDPDPMARAGTRNPAGLERRVGYQRVLGRSADLQDDVLAALRRTLLDPASYAASPITDVVSEPCQWIVVLLSGEDARTLGIDLDKHVLTVASGAIAHADVRLALSPKGLAAIAPLTRVTIKSGG